MIEEPIQPPAEGEEQKEPVVKDGTAQQTNYGENNKDLPEDLQKALRDIIREVEKDDYTARLDEVKRVRRARLYYQDEQHLVPSGDGTWKSLTDLVGVYSRDNANEQSPYTFTENIYRAFCETFTAAMSQNYPAVKFVPQSAKDPADIATADAADDIADVISRQNDIDAKTDEACYYLYNDGSVYFYIRSVSDGERFGYTEQPILAQVMQPVDQMGTMAPVPVQVGTQQVPNSQEVLDLFGILEVKVPSYAKTLLQAPYLDLSIEARRGYVKATYPHIADKLPANTANANEGATDQQDRLARMTLYSGTKQFATGSRGYENLITFKRVWLRPWIFDEYKDETVGKQLKEIFPHGAYVAFAGDVYCESRDEKMDDRWEAIHVREGSGNQRQGLGHDVIDVQDQLNTLTNIEADTHEHGVPFIAIDDQALDQGAYSDMASLPGQALFAQRIPGQPMGSAFYVSEPAAVSPQLIRRQEQLRGEIPQFLLGLQPAIFGSDTGQDTASGFAMQRDQAMGRIGLIWKRYGKGLARTMEKAVRCFFENHSGDVKLLVMGDKGVLDDRLINLDQLTGKFFAHAEVADGFPITLTQKRNNISTLLGSANPAVQQLLFSSPEAIEATGKALGLDISELPGDLPKKHQEREIAQMLEGQPAEVDPIADDHAIHGAVIKSWLESDAGQRTKAENPQGWMAVHQHLEMHLMIVQQQQMQQAQAEAAANPPKEGGEGPPAN